MKIEIDTIAEYEECIARGYEPLVDVRFEMKHSLRVQVQKERFGANDALGNAKFYKFCLKHLSLVCEECGLPITYPSAYNVSHILSRGSHQEMAHDPRNINILCPRCHNRWEHATTRKGMVIYYKNEEKITKLKQEYNEC